MSRKRAKHAPAMKRGEWRVEDRFVTSAARRLADQAIDDMPEDERMSAFLDEWLRVYRAAGGVERRRTG